MVAWWWVLIGSVGGAVAAFWFIAVLRRSVIVENVGLIVENERLRRRIQMIGERKRDGTPDPFIMNAQQRN